MKNRQNILDRLMSVVGIFESVFWKFTDLIVYDEEKEKVKRILKEVYWYTDVDRIFPPELDYESFEKTSKVLFTYYDGNNDDKKRD